MDDDEMIHGEVAVIKKQVNRDIANHIRSTQLQIELNKKEM